MNSCMCSHDAVINRELTVVVAEAAGRASAADDDD